MGEPVNIKELAKRMILLSGKNIKDIKIEFTGLRKGENYLNNFISMKKIYLKHK